jgi:L-2-hydroxyglutarate oxidase LhgO
MIPSYLEVESIVVGAGVVGMSIARELSAKGIDCFLLDSAGSFGTGISSRNSEVVHAGIYYPQNSLKARLCVEGRHKLYEFCQQKGVEYRKCGKLIVAPNEASMQKLSDLMDRGRSNGVEDLALLDANAIAGLEPEIGCHAAVISPQSGIVDSHGLMQTLIWDFESTGGVFLPKHVALKVESSSEGFEVEIDTPDGRVLVRTDLLFNATGLSASRLAANIVGLSAQFIPEVKMCKGTYMTIARRNVFTHLIYPIPEENLAGLGVHATLDLSGGVRFGPDVEYVQEEDYGLDQGLKEAMFMSAIETYWPAVRQHKLCVDYAGIRPKLQGEGEAPVDFSIQGPEVHKLQGLWNLFGIESPGLTASLALGSYLVSSIT